VFLGWNKTRPNVSYVFVPVFFGPDPRLFGLFPFYKYLTCLISCFRKKNRDFVIYQPSSVWLSARPPPTATSSRAAASVAWTVKKLPSGRVAEWTVVKQSPREILLVVGSVGVSDP
jgi:hypothetical protein